MKIVFGKKNEKAKQSFGPNKKVLLKKKPSRLEDLTEEDEEDDDDESTEEGEASWLITRREDQRNAAKKAALMSGNRAPEVWFKDGDEKVLRFRSGPYVLFTYNLKMGGNRFHSATKPAKGQVDLFAEEGMKPQFVALYEVIDRTGYEKDGKVVKNVVRFFKATNRIYQQLETIERKRGPLNQYDITVSRTGSGKQTTYTLMPELPEKLPSALRELPSIAKDIAKYYAPPKEAEQRTLLASCARSKD